jgi:hypothetical protein
MRSIQAVLLILVLSPCGLSQQTSPPAVENGDPTRSLTKPEPRASVSGKVVSGASGEPLKKAFITLRRTDGGRREQPYTAITKEDGWFEINEVPAGQYRMTVLRNGYVRHVFGARNARQQQGGNLTLAAGQKLRDLAIKLTPGAVIAGRIVDQDGEPMAGVSVTVLRYMFMDGERRLQPQESTMTNDLGEYRIFGLQPRSYYLSAQVRGGGTIPSVRGGMGFVMADGEMEESFGNLYYPGVTDATNASSIEVRAGEEFRADMTVVPMRTYRVSGRVLDNLGEPAKGGNVMLMNRGSGTFMPAGMSMISGGQGPRDGRFEMRGVAPGSYTLTAFIRGDEMLTTQMDVEVGNADVEGLNVVLSTARELAGVVRVEGDGKLKASDLQIFFSPARGGMFGGFGNASVKEDGTFVAKNLMSDDYLVSLNLNQPDAYLKSIRAGGEELIYSGVNVGKVRGPLEVIVSTRGGTAEGVVKGADGKTAAGALVVLIPDKPVRARFGTAKTAATDQNGNYRIRGLRPGKYKVFALESGDDDEYQDPAFAKRYDEYGSTLEIKESTLVTNELKLMPTVGAGAYSGN